MLCALFTQFKLLELDCCAVFCSQVGDAREAAAQMVASQSHQASPSGHIG